MAESPFGFLRGAAAVMAADLVVDAEHRDAGAAVRRCTHPQLRHLRHPRATSLVLHQRLRRDTARPVGMGRQAVRGQPVRRRRRPGSSGRALSTTWWSMPCGCYRRRLAGYAEMTNLEVWYDHKGIDDVLTHYDPQTREQVERDIAKAFRRGHDRAVRRLAEIRPDGSVRFREDPPITVASGRTSAVSIVETVGVLEQYVRQPARRQAGPDGPLPARRRRAPGGRGRQCRDPGVGGPVRIAALGARRSDRAADQAGRGLRARAVSAAIGVRSSGPQSRCRSTAHPGPDGQLPGLVQLRRRAQALLRPPAVGPQGSFRSDDDEPVRIGQPCPVVRLGTRPGARPLRRARR